MTPGNTPNATILTFDDASGAVSNRIALAIAAGLLLVAFVGTLQNKFVWDDNRQIVDNFLIQDPQYFRQALRSDVWAFKAERPGAASNYWRPATVLWMMALYGAFGLNPAGWHVVSVLAHGVNVVLVYYLVKRLTRNRDAAAVAAWLFAVHPVHVESVVWPSASVDIQMCLGVLPALLIYLKHRQAWRAGPMGIAALFYAFAMFSKETSVVFPAIVFGCEWFLARAEGSPVATRSRRAVIAALPFVAVVALYAGLRVFVARISVQAPPQPMGLREFAIFVPEALAFYLRQCMLPVFLSPIHSLRGVAGGFNGWLWLSPVALVVAVLGFRRWGRRGGVDALAVLIFVLPLSLAIWGARNFPPDERVHDRYLYLPVLGVILYVVIRFADRGRALLVGGGAVALAFCGLSAAYGREWRSDVSLWECAVRRAPNAPVGYVHLIDEYRRAGRLEECPALVTRALAIDPNHIETVIAAGVVAAELGDYAEAEKRFRAVLDFDKQFQVAADQLGQVLTKQGRFDEAIGVFEEARRNFPLLKVKYTTNIAVVAFMAGQIPRATAELESVSDELDRQPDRSFRRFHMNLAELYVRIGRPQDAIREVQRFLDVTEETSDERTAAERRRATVLLDELGRSGS